MNIPHFTKCLGSLLTFALLTFSCSQDTETTFAELIIEETIATETITPDEEVTEEAAEPIIDYQKGTLVLNEDTKVALDITKGAEENSTTKKTYSLKSITQPKNGKTEMNNNNEIVYSPAADYHGDDSFSYTLNIQDSTETTIEQVNTFNITITPSKDVVNDVITTPYETTKTITPLANDTFAESSDVTITEISLANKGIAVLNSDNTINYTPNKNTTGEDVILYKAILTNSDASETIENGTIKITIDESQKISSDIQFLKEQFDDRWNNIEKEDAISRSLSKNKNQEYYFLGLYIDSLTSMWRATGDSTYLDEALLLINNTMEDSQIIGNYKGWLASDGIEYALWDSYYWRYVASLIRIMYQSPSILNNSKYRSQYNTILEFSEKNIWERYENDSLGNFYRINTHMASHWARIGMELFIITNKTKYKTVFENITYANNTYLPSTIKNRIYKNAKVPDAYTWSSSWTSALTSRIQDTSHGGAVVSLITTAYDNDMYFNSDDINALVNTIDKVIYPDNSEISKKYVDGSGGDDLPGRIHEWLQLGKYNITLNNKFKDKYITNYKNLNYFGCQAIGIVALNTTILEKVNAYFPEE